MRAVQTSDSTPPTDPALERLLALLSAWAQAGSWQQLVLSQPRAAPPAPRRVQVRPLVLRAVPCLSFVYSHPTRDETHNLPLQTGLDQVAELLHGSFRHAHLFGRDGEAQLRLSKKGSGHFRLRKAAAGASGPDVEPDVEPGDPPDVEPGASPAHPVRTHDRQKKRRLTLDRPFLSHLGITNAQQQLVPAMARKWKQINKFIEVFDHALQRSPLADSKTLRVVDFGAGKAYLSFALHDWLSHGLQLDAQVTGVELRPDLVQQGQHIAAELGLQGMRLRQGDVRTEAEQTQVEPMDVMIALHACDTATDHAIHLGLRAGAQIIMCSPCCHKELRPQLLSPQPLRSIFQHGIHAEQQAEMLTDSLRALLLQAQGYDTQVFEFVSLEHTRKNKMILAIKRAQPLPAEPALAQVQELKRFFGLRTQCLEMLLAAG